MNLAAADVDPRGSPLPKVSADSRRWFRRLLALVLVSSLCWWQALAQDAASADRNAINTTARPGGMLADSPVTFPKEGALPAKYPPDVKERTEPSEKDYYLFSTPCRSLGQIAAIQKEMPPGQFTHPPGDWTHLRHTRRILTEGGDLRLLALGDSIVNDTMRSGWVALLQEAYPQARIEARVFVRGGGGCQHYRAEGRVEKHILPWKPDLVFIGGISQKDIESIREVIRQLRAGLPEVEILLATGAFGTTDPRDPDALAQAPHSGTGAYGRALKALAAEQRCAYLDLTRPWAEYIRSAQVHPHLFYRDVVHANEFGEQILAKAMMAFWTAPEARPAMDKLRLVVLTDISNEPDDQQSLVRFLTYANEFDVEGLIATTSCWRRQDPALSAILRVLDAYEIAEKNLRRHASGYPSAPHLRSIAKRGVDGFGMSAAAEQLDNEGVRHIVSVLEHDDPRPVWFCAWGGGNTLGGAVAKLQRERPADVARLVGKIRGYEIALQDDGSAWIAHHFREAKLISARLLWRGISRTTPGFNEVRAI